MSRVRTPDRAVGHCFCDVEGRGDGDFFVLEMKMDNGDFFGYTIGRTSQYGRGKMRIPKHVAVIPDGNRRWAVNHKLKKQEGYDHGLEPGLKVLKKAIEYGISEITYYGFTKDNCKRPKVQQQAFQKACVDAVKMIEEQGDVSLLVLGDSESDNFPENLLSYRERQDIGEPKIKVNFLVNYGWDWDLKGMRSKEIPRVDLVIRWGNMRRLSGMLPIQCVYSDFYVVERCWPDYQEEDFDKALLWYDKQDVTLGG